MKWCAGLALCDAQIEMYDNMIGASVRHGQSVWKKLSISIDNFVLYIGFRAEGIQPIKIFLFLQNI